MLLNVLISQLWESCKDKIVEKLAPKPETSPEAEKLQKIQEILRGFADRYYSSIPVAEIYDPINEVLGEESASDDDLEDYLDIGKGGSQIPGFIISAVSHHMAQDWVYPNIPAAFHLYYHLNLVQSGFYERVGPWMPAKKDDIAVWDGSHNYGNGMLGIVVADRDDKLLAYTQSSTKSGPKICPKSGLLGYFRPIPQKDAEK